MKFLEKYYPHLSAFAGFIIVSLIYFYPVLQGKQIYQSDIVQYTGMAKEQNDFRAAQNTEPYWTNSAFGGMPTYQLGAKYPYDYVGGLDDMIRFLPRPADYLFLYFIGFYILLLVLRIRPLLAFAGALAFGFSTYLVIILGVGHNAKAHAIGYMPLVVAGVLLVFKRKYIIGGIVTMLAAALEINANHFQMTYYLLMLLLIIGIYYIVLRIREKDYRSLMIAVGVFLVAGVLSVGANATSLMATSEYAEFSTRGKSQLTLTPEGKPKGSSALSRDYITEYSYGIAESLNLIAPRLFGGSNSENLGTDSEVYQYIIQQGAPEDQAKEFSQSLPAYWGDQPIVAAPAYIGAVVFFLAVIALWANKRKIKYVFLAGAILSLMLSWGKNFSVLTDFFIDFVPLYDKFRAVSSIQVILELCMPVLAIMGLQWFFSEEDKDRKWNFLWKSAATVLGLIAMLFLFKGSFSFSGGSDQMFLQNYGADFVQALKLDRKSAYSADLLRSGFLVICSAGILWLFILNRLSEKTAIALVALFMVGDLFFIDKRYLDGQSFVSASQVKEPFAPTPADLEILQDPGHYRVFEISGNLSSARASYFHKSLGGYHAAKPARVQDLFDYHITRNNLEMLDMYNVKYIIQVDEKGQEFPIQNPEANGNAWFVRDVRAVNTADAEMRALSNLDTKKTAVVNVSEFGSKLKTRNFKNDTTAAVIKLQKYQPNYLQYVSNNPSNGLAVFSESYYGNGWQAYIDKKPVPHIRANYALRALEVPAGKHLIEFRFEPQVIKTGSSIALISSILMLVLIGAGIFLLRRRNLQSNPI